MEYVAVFALGVFAGYVSKTVKYYTYSPPNLSHRYTYNEILKFVGGKPVRKRGAVCGSRNIAITIDDSIAREDNTIYFRGSSHRGCSPSNPGHQSIKYVLNKKINETKGEIYIFVKMRDNEYAFIGWGKRNGKYFTIQRKSRNVLVFPIRYMSGHLPTIMNVLENEIASGNSGSSSGSGSD